MKVTANRENANSFERQPNLNLYTSTLDLEGISDEK
jgi:hypothetical protein